MVAPSPEDLYRLGADAARMAGDALTEQGRELLDAMIEAQRDQAVAAGLPDLHWHCGFLDTLRSLPLKGMAK